MTVRLPFSLFHEMYDSQKLPSDSNRPNLPHSVPRALLPTCLFTLEPGHRRTVPLLRKQLRAVQLPPQYVFPRQTKWIKLKASLDSDGPVGLELPEQWLWDILDEFIYQFQSFSVWRSKVKNKTEEEIILLAEGSQVSSNPKGHTPN